MRTEGGVGLDFEGLARRLARDPGHARDLLARFEPGGGIHRLSDQQVRRRLEEPWQRLPPCFESADQHGLAMLGHGAVRSGLVPASGKLVEATVEADAAEEAPVEQPLAPAPRLWTDGAQRRCRFVGSVGFRCVGDRAAGAIT